MIRSQQNFNQRLRQRLIGFIAFCGLVWIILLIQLWRLQFIQHQKYADLSLNNRIRIKRIKAERGLIKDRYNTVLVSSRPAFHAALILEDAGDSLKRSLANLSRLLNKPLERYEEIVSQEKSKHKPFDPLLLDRHLSFNQVAVLEENQRDIPGITVIVEPTRNYHYGSMAAHVLGYLKEINDNQLTLPQYREVKSGDLIGQYGVEKSFNTYLSGEDGGKQVEVNAEGRELEVLGQRQPVSGRDIVLTLDAQLQLKAEELLKGKSGSIVALDPNNGDVLALASSPGFDPNQIVTGLTKKQWDKIANNPKTPLQNKAIQSLYHPGSVFKLIMTTAGLRQGVLSLETSSTCQGEYYFGNRFFSCWREGGHGTLSLLNAFEQSCNVFYYKLGQQLGVDTIAAYANFYGLGRPSGIDLAGEQEGIVPSSKWKKKRFKLPWYPGETLSLSIGQGYLTVTPLQLANAIATAANKGSLYRPRLVLEVVKTNGKLEQSFPPEVLSRLNLTDYQWQILHSVLRKVVEGDRGTGRSAKIQGVVVGGKTGTAQVVAKRPEFEDLKDDQIPEQYRDNAWFVAFAEPNEQSKPLIAVSVLVEHGGHGGSACAPLARDIIGEYLRLRYPDLLPPSLSETSNAVDLGRSAGL
ncbi:MAG: penicillin-binding protein 2 [Candidatus Schekmanbacteria bacterium]|nr:penicillin-binding protein 2 [Candidatus Schekmanbacteria bacterium]